MKIICLVDTKSVLYAEPCSSPPLLFSRFAAVFKTKKKEKRRERVDKKMNEADFILPDAPRLIDLSQIATIEELVARREGITSRYNDFVGLLASRRSHLQEALR